MKVLVTGASGFIGRRMTERLSADGQQVRAVFRRSASFPELRGVEWVQADLDLGRLSSNERRLWRAALRQYRRQKPAAAAFLFAALPVPETLLQKARVLLADCDAVVHIAALTSDWGSPETFIRANSLPTLALLRACSEQASRRFVYVSSIAVHGFGPHRQTSEAGPYYPVNNPYQCSKRLSESLVLGAVENGLDARIVRPGNVYGPGDTTTFFPIFDAMVQGQMGTIDRGERLTCPVYIDDLIDGLSQALHNDLAIGATYNVVGPDRITWRELCDQSTQALQVKPVRTNAPGAVAFVLGALLEGLFRLVRAKDAPPITRYRITQLQHDYDFATGHAATGLGYQAKTGFSKGIQAAVADWKVRQPS